MKAALCLSNEEAYSDFLSKENVIVTALDLKVESQIAFWCDYNLVKTRLEPLRIYLLIQMEILH